MLRRIVLVGATGFFGYRLAERLATIPDISLVVTSREETRARAVANSIERKCSVTPLGVLAFERNDGESLYRLRQLSPWLVIDASGPFQSVDYDLSRASLEMGAHWIDLADARAYLLGFEAALDSLARSKGLVARAGASSTPALSVAVVEDLTRGWQRLDSVDIAIMPGGAGQVGEAVIRAILSYAGIAISVFDEGAAATITGWGKTRRVDVDGIGVRHLSPVETADAALLPPRFAITSRVAFHAGLESRIEQFGLLTLAKLRERGFIGSLERLAPLLQSARRVTRLSTSDRGGMTVDCAGLDADGRQIWSRWKLLAEKDEGPNVPVLPAVALVRALLRGDVAVGAGMAAGMPPLSTIEAEMQAPGLRTSRESIKAADRSLFARVCRDESYHALPSALRAFHDGNGPVVWSGKADIDASGNLIAWCIRSLFGFPPAGRSIPVTVSVDRRGDGEIWTRNFAGRRFASHLLPEGGNVVSERFGPFKILLAIDAANGDVEMPIIGWRIGSIRLPLVLAPKSKTREFVDEHGRFCFDVSISLPLAGLLARYRGWLEPKPRLCRRSALLTER